MGGLRASNGGYQWTLSPTALTDFDNGYCVTDTNNQLDCLEMLNGGSIYTTNSISTIGFSDIKLEFFISQHSKAAYRPGNLDNITFSYSIDNTQNWVPFKIMKGPTDITNTGKNSGYSVPADLTTLDLGPSVNNNAGIRIKIDNIAGDVSQDKIYIDELSIVGTPTGSAANNPTNNPSISQSEEPSISPTTRYPTISSQNPTNKPSISPTTRYPTTSAQNTIGDCSERRRRSWSDLSTEERNVYIDGFRQLADNGITQQFTYTHSVSAYHQQAKMLPWHRGFIYEMETAIRNLGGKYSCFGLPYWDWSDPEAYDLILNSGLGGDSEGVCLNDGSKFENGQYDPYRGTCLIRNPTESKCSFVTPQHLIDIIDNNENFAGYWPDLDASPHVIPHNCMGGEVAGSSTRGHMGDLFYSPDDPIFYLHHTYMDYQWSLWQDCWNYDGETNDVTNSMYSENVDDELVYSPYTTQKYTVRETLDLAAWKIKYEKGPFWDNAMVDDEDHCGYAAIPINEDWFYEDNQESRRRQLHFGDNKARKAQNYAKTIYQGLKQKYKNRRELVHIWAKAACRFKQQLNGGTACEIPDDFDDCSNMDINDETNDIDISLDELLSKRGINDCMKDTINKFYVWAKQSNTLLSLCAGCYAPFCDRNSIKDSCASLFDENRRKQYHQQNIIPVPNDLSNDFNEFKYYSNDAIDHDRNNYHPESGVNTFTLTQTTSNLLLFFLMMLIVCIAWFFCQSYHCNKKRNIYRVGKTLDSEFEDVDEENQHLNKLNK